MRFHFLCSHRGLESTVLSPGKIGLLCCSVWHLTFLVVASWCLTKSQKKQHALLQTRGNGKNQNRTHPACGLSHSLMTTKKPIFMPNSERGFSYPPQTAVAYNNSSFRQHQKERTLVMKGIFTQSSSLLKGEHASSRNPAFSMQIIFVSVQMVTSSISTALKVTSHKTNNRQSCNVS